MILRSPLGRLLSLLLTAGVAAIVYFGFIKDKVDSSGSDPTKAGAESLFKRANFTKALGAVRAREGGGAPMLKIQVLPGQGEFQIKEGQRARGYRYDPKSGDLEKIKVQIVGPGSIEGEDFSLRRVPTDVTERLDRAVRAHKGLHATVMTLERGTVDRQLRWTVNAEGNGRTGIVFNANADGSGIQQPGGNITQPKSFNKARRQQQCIVAAGSDTKKMQACLKR